MCVFVLFLTDRIQIRQTQWYMIIILLIKLMEVFRLLYPALGDNYAAEQSLRNNDVDRTQIRQAEWYIIKEFFMFLHHKQQQ